MSPPLGDQELSLLGYISEHAPITVGEAFTNYGQAKGLARTTILTMMERLRAKGYLTRQQVNGVQQYQTCFNQKDVLRGLVQHFVEKTLGGTLSPFVAYLTENQNLSENELEELKRLVDNLESKGN